MQSYRSALSAACNVCVYYVRIEPLQDIKWFNDMTQFIWYLIAMESEFGIIDDTNLTV